MDLPTHPESDDTEPDHIPPGPTTSRGARLVIAIIVGLVLVVILLHLTGVVGPA